MNASWIRAQDRRRNLIAGASTACLYALAFVGAWLIGSLAPASLASVPGTVIVDLGGDEGPPGETPQGLASAPERPADAPPGAAPLPGAGKSVPGSGARAERGRRDGSDSRRSRQPLPGSASGCRPPRGRGYGRGSSRPAQDAQLRRQLDGAGSASSAGSRDFRGNERRARRRRRHGQRHLPRIRDGQRDGDDLRRVLGPGRAQYLRAHLPVYAPARPRSTIRSIAISRPRKPSSSTIEQSGSSGGS